MNTQDLQANDGRLLKTYMLALGVFTALLFYVLSWGAYSVQLPIVKVRQWTGTLSRPGFERLIAECVQQNRWSCAESAYLDLFKSKHDLEAMGQLGYLQFRLGKVSEANKSYEYYFQNGGKNPAIALQYGMALEKAGDYENALRFVNLSMASTPEKLHANATAEIIKILTAQKKYAQAKKLIENFWKSAENAKGYFNNEYQVLSKLVSVDVKPKGATST